MDDVPQRLDFEDAEKRFREASPDDAGQRLDLFLGPLLPEFSRASLQRLIRRGAMLVNGEKTRPSRKIQAGDKVTMEVPRILPPTVEPEDLPLEVLAEEPSFIVLNKPAGMAVHPGRGRTHGTLANALAHHYPGASRRGGLYRPGIVHRLDMDTSGVMVVALTEAAHAVLAGAFKARMVEKEYRSLVHGDPAHEEDVIDLPLGRDLVKPERMAVRFDGGREALTEVEVLERFGDVAYLALFPKTGRTHQLRVHLKSRGHAILADPIYAPGFKTPVPVPRLMLHAFRLTFPHPDSGEPLEMEAPLPEDFRSVLAALRAIDAAAKDV